MPERFFPPVSVIVNTDGRARSLATCVEGLRQLRYPNFEVVVVAGPTRDGTHEYCRALGPTIKYADCPVRNLSVSRNASIRMAAGDIVAFIDDDAIPEPEWLDDVVPAFSDPEVGVAGGFVYDHTGASYQWTYGTLDRFGTADLSWKRATPEFNFPGTFIFPHVIGANSIFRRSALVSVGGFDEEYEYFLDESDVILRLVDEGWKVAQLEKGFVHHKYLPSHIRNEARVLTSWYSVIKNKTYFCLQNAADHATTDEIMAVVRRMIDELRETVRWAIREKLLEATEIERFEDEARRALQDGRTRGSTAIRRTCEPHLLRQPPAFERFRARCEAREKRCFLFLSRTYPPAGAGGIARYVNQLAVEVAGLGHHVHVLTAGEGHDRVDFEDGVWVHRLAIQDAPAPAGLHVPAHLWSYSQRMYEEACAIGMHREVHAVFAPIWDIEGVAFWMHGRFRLVTSLHTTLACYLASNPEKAKDDVFRESFATPVLALERRLMLESDVVLANSEAIVEEVERAYALSLRRDSLQLVPHGIRDWTELPREDPARLCPGRLRVCFVGRLELRKGADVFLAILPRLLEKFPSVHVDVVGADPPLSGGRTLRTRFERTHPEPCALGRVAFHGEVSEPALRGFYAGADVIVAPSRFESFGLVHLEAMMFGKPVVGCAVGGTRELIVDGVSGLLAQPGDPESLFECIARLIHAPAERQRIGAAARARYLELFEARRMAEGVVRGVETSLGLQR